MLLPDKSPKPPERVSRQRSLRRQRLPSPALCCACGLCIMLAGINITLVGAFAFGTFIPTSNLPIIIGPILLLIALAFFTACCVISRRLLALHTAQETEGGEKWGLMRMGTAILEMEMSERTPQDTTAVQFSPTDSPASSRGSTSGCQAGDGELHTSEMFDTGDNPTMTSDLRETAQNISSA